MGSHKLHRLTALSVKKINTPGKYGDGHGLYLIVDSSGAKRWEQRLTVQGRRRDIGLGSLSLVSLEEAREIALKNKRLARDGGDPIAEKRVAEGQNISFKDVAMSVYQLNAPSYRNAKYAAQWLSSLENHAFAVIGSKAIGSITSADILSVLSPIWVEKNDTAKKIRQRLSQIMKWAKAQGYYSGDNPVELAEHALPKISKIDSHHAALAFSELPNMVQRLSESALMSSTRMALLFLLLTASRQSEVLYANWDEIDIKNRQWVVPASRMKAGAEHIVPLTDKALDILNEAKELYPNSELLFPNERSGRALSDNAMRLALQKRLGLNTTLHGLRSSFKDWASEKTNYQNEVSEMALAHSISNAVEAAYRRGNLYEKRCQLMRDWVDYLYGGEKTVIQLVQGQPS